MLAYLTYMAERLEQMHRILKPTGSIYLHCDPTASHYLKILMDAIFGAINFRNEIVWKRATSQAKGSQHLPKTWGANTDSIFFYSKGRQSRITPFRMLNSDEILRKFPKVDEKGRRFKDDSAHIWSSPGMGARPNLCFTWRGFTNPHPSGWRLSKARLEEEYQKGNIVIHPNGKLERRAYEESYRGEPIGNLWADIDPAMGNERLGYPTQKPVKLLERIIGASSKKGDIVLDPFCGCGTTIDAARRLDRNWIGIDVSSFAIDLIRTKRLREPNTPIKGIPYDFASARMLARDNPFSFESWAVTRLPGFVPNIKQIGDGGIDGRATLATKPDNFDSRLGLAQVKGGGGFHLGSLRDFIHVINRDKAAVGCFITLDQVGSLDARKEVANSGKILVKGYEYRRMQLWSISDYFDDRLPSLPVMNDPYSGRPLIQSDFFSI